MMRILSIFAALLGLASVALGAAGDHALSTLDENARHMYDTALRYHQLYAAILLAVGLYGLSHEQSRAYRAAAILLLFGTVIFCASLYAAVFTGMTTLTYLTPVGGILLMSGWLALAIALWMTRKN